MPIGHVPVTSSSASFHIGFPLAWVKGERKVANRRFASATRKRRMSWDGVNVDITDLVVATAQFTTVLTESILENFPTPTIVRSRGKLAVLTDLSSTPGSFGTVTMGLIVVTSAASAAGGVPNPATQTGNDWLWWEANMK